MQLIPYRLLSRTRVTGVSVSEQVNISYDNKIVRIKSPDLKRWIETDMSKTIEDRLSEQQKQLKGRIVEYNQRITWLDNDDSY